MNIDIRLAIKNRRYINIMISNNDPSLKDPFPHFIIVALKKKD